MTSRSTWLSWLACFFILRVSPVFSQTVSLPTEGAYVPGQYVPLRVDIDSPGDIHVRGDSVQGIDLPAAGRGSVVVPLMIWQTTGGDIDLLVNGHPQRLHVRPIERQGDVPQSVQDFWNTGGTRPAIGAPSAMPSPAAYDSLDLWNPGRSELVRKFLLRAALIAILTLGAAMYVRRRASPMMVAAVSVCVTAGAILAMPKDIARLQQPLTTHPPRAYENPPASDPHAPQWVWRTSTHAETIEEPFGRNLWFVPRSIEHLAALNPVLVCDARGNPLAIRVSLSGDSDSGNDRAAFVLTP